MGGNHATALAPLLSADAADRTIVALDGMAPEQALALASQVEGLPSLLLSGLVTFALGRQSTPRELSAQQLPAPSDGWADHQPRTEPKMWSYGCREENKVLPERCGIRINTFVKAQP